MKLGSARFLFRKNCLGAVLLVGMMSCVQSVWASSETVAIDSLKKQIRQLVVNKKYRPAAKSYGHLGWLYQQQVHDGLLFQQS
jgi:hypothetical protein